MFRGKARNEATIIAAAAVCALLPAEAQAVIAPQYERLRQFHFALEAYQNSREILPEPIDRIELLDASTFRLSAKRCFVVVTLTAKPPSNPLVLGKSTDYEASVSPWRCD